MFGHYLELHLVSLHHLFSLQLPPRFEGLLVLSQVLEVEANVEVQVAVDLRGKLE